jgi:membrane fusion protein (multidrug efflux system)
VGQYAQAGTNLTMFVPDEIWVTELQRPSSTGCGRSNRRHRNRLYPERAFRGHVDSVQPGSGPAFSLLLPRKTPPGTIKIVQRVPVSSSSRSADPSPRPRHVGRPDRASSSPSLYERLRARVGAMAEAGVSDTAPGRRSAGQ